MMSAQIGALPGGLLASGNLQQGGGGTERSIAGDGLAGFSDGAGMDVSEALLQDPVLYC